MALKVADPAHGQLTLNADGSFTYTPATNFAGSDTFAYRAFDGKDYSSDGTFSYTPEEGFFGTDTFTYKVSDGLLDSQAATVTITVTPVNDPPVASDDSYETDEDTQLAAGSVLANDTDVDSTTLSAVKVSDPQHGSVSFNSDGTFTYTPDTDWFGTDTFTYKANDGNSAGNLATVSIIVNPVDDAPIAENDTFSTHQDVALTILPPGLLANDTDAEGSSLTAVKLTDPTHGTVASSPDGSFVYTPNAGWYGTDSFTYKANDGSLDSDPATVTIQVRQPVGCFDYDFSTRSTVDAGSGTDGSYAPGSDFAVLGGRVTPAMYDGRLRIGHTG